MDEQNHVSCGGKNHGVWQQTMQSLLPSAAAVGFPTNQGARGYARSVASASVIVQIQLHRPSPNVDLPFCVLDIEPRVMILAPVSCTAFRHDRHGK